MHGKTVKFRHCPPTVSGRELSASVTASEQPVWEDRCEVRGSRKSGDRFSHSLLCGLFSEGERIMAALIFLVLLISPFEILNGTIFDPAGAVVGSATVEISGPAFSRSASTSDSGAFSIADIPAGSYSLRVTAKGFAPSATAA